MSDPKPDFDRGRRRRAKIEYFWFKREEGRREGHPVDKKNSRQKACSDCLEPEERGRKPARLEGPYVQSGRGAYQKAERERKRRGRRAPILNVKQSNRRGQSGGRPPAGKGNHLCENRGESVGSPPKKKKKKKKKKKGGTDRMLRGWKSWEKEEQRRTRKVNGDVR